MFRRISEPIAAGAPPRRIHLPFKMVQILAIAGASSVKVSFEFDPEQTWRPGLGLMFDKMQNFIDIRNDSGSAITVDIVFSDDSEIVDTALVIGSGALPVSQAAASSSFVSQPNTNVRSFPTIAANTNRKGIDIRNVGSVPLFVRTGTYASTPINDNHGFRLNPGEVLSLNTQALIAFADDTSLGAGVAAYSYLEYT